MKKFSKFVAFALTCLLALSLCACGSSKRIAASDIKDYSDIKAGLICLHDENSTYDANFINGFKSACESIGVSYEIVTNVPEGQECTEKALDLIDKGCNYIFADSFGHEDYLKEVAKDYPDVVFCHATGTQAHTSGLDNFHNAFATIFEGRYLAGIAAGMKLNEMIANGDITAEQAIMGYVGAYPYAEVKSGYTSFYLGAKSVCPTVTMKVTFTSSWYDETAEKEGAKNLINAGCVLISQHADSMGAPSACEDAGVPNVSYNGSTASSCPNTFIISSKIDWAPYFSYCFTQLVAGEPIATDYTGTIATGSVVLTELGSAAAPGTQEAIDAAKAKLNKGEIKVFDTNNFTVGGQKLTSYMADVDSDANFTPDTEVIVDGYFNESGDGLRSAPFFDIDIDGISMLGK